MKTYLAVSVTLLLIAAAFGLCNIALAGENSTVFKVEDYGAVADGETDCRFAIEKAVEAAMKAGPGSIVKFSPGKYKTSARDINGCIWLVQANGIIIEGAGKETEIIVTEPRATCFQLIGCKNVTIKNLAVDYDPLPFTQGTIVAVDAQAGSFDLQIHPGFSPLSEKWYSDTTDLFQRWGMIFDPKKKLLKTGAPDHVYILDWTNIKDNIWRLRAHPEQVDRVASMATGDRFVHMARSYGSVHMLQYCENCRIENVIIYTSPSTAVTLSMCSGITVDGVQVRFRRGSDRLLTMDADGVHCPLNRAGPTIINCHFEGMADDGVNIYAAPNIVKQVVSPTQLVVTNGHFIQPGDMLQIMNPREGIVVGTVKAKSIEQKDDQLSLVTLERPVEAVTAGSDKTDADTIYNLAASGPGYRIANNTFKNHRRHALLMRGGHGVIENNVIEQTSGLGIVVTNEPFWPEGPFAENIIIRNNTIKGVGYSHGYGDIEGSGAIQIKGITLSHKLAKEHAQKNITIENNTIINPPSSGIYIGSAKDIRIIGNRIEAAPGHKSRRRAGAIVLDNCSSVVIDDLTVIDKRPGTIAAVEIESTVTAADAGVKIGKINADLVKDAKLIIDKRK